MGVRPPDQAPEQAAPNHSPLFFVDESALPLGPGNDPKLLRLFLLGAANHVRVWHRTAMADGGLDAAGIAAALVRLLRDPAGS